MAAGWCSGPMDFVTLHNFMVLNGYKFGFHRFLKGNDVSRCRKGSKKK